MAPLSGIKIVELGVMIAVPGAAETLAGFGASVIKVEDTKRGDELRNYGSSKNGISAWFANTNAGKKSLSVDLATQAGKEILWKILADADVFIQGFRSGVVGKFGFDYDTVSKKLPKLIYCSSTGFGETGPYADLPAYDPLIQALSGWAGFQSVDGKPTLHKAMVADKTAAVFNAQAITAALVQRGRTGEGCFIEASMLESNVMFNWPDVMMHCSLLEEDGTHMPNLFASYRLYRCADGYATIACGTDRQWQSYCTALEGQEFLDDNRFKTASDRNANIVEFFNATEALSSKFSVDEVVERLRAADVPVAPVHSPEEVMNDPQIMHRNFIEERSHPRVGRFLGAKQPASMFNEDLELSPAPMLGEHTREILAEIGFDETNIDRMHNEGVINCHS
jgi:crotonobetainyl-CoA:carnitine CoA-transferase CaiB-like acyl-CoA transferase